MTSRLRRKHPITRLNTSRANHTEPLPGGGATPGVWLELSPAAQQTGDDSSPLAGTWLPAALLATLTLLASSLPALGAPGKLQWRRPARPSVAASRTQPSVTHHQVQQAAAAWHAGDQEGVAGANIRRVSWDQLANDDGRTAEPLNDEPFNDELSRELSAPFGLPPEQTPTVTPPDTTLEQDFFPGTTPLEPLQPLPDESAEQPDEEEEDFFRLPSQAEQDTVLTRERQAAQKACEEELEELKADRIATIDLTIGIDGEEGRDFPHECSLDDGSAYEQRAWAQVTYRWKAAANCHKPLYFEDVQLERYGHSCGPCLQPIVSGAHFFTRIPMLPYCMGLKAPTECVYPLGHYRPGNCAPYMVPAIPFTLRAGLYETGAVFGLIGFLP